MPNRKLEPVASIQAIDTHDAVKTTDQVRVAALREGDPGTARRHGWDGVRTSSERETAR